MSRFQFTTAHYIGVIAGASVIAGAYLVNPRLGLALVVAAGLAAAGYRLRDEVTSLLDRCAAFLSRPAGPVSRIGLFLWIVTAPAVLFFDPVEYAPNRYGHIERRPRETYRLFSDDVAYIAASRTWDRTMANLMVPHNTHIVPAWRLLTWALTASAGRLQQIPEVLAVASYGILIAVMLMSGCLVARETGRASLGLAAMVLVGTTSLMLTPVLWYSGGQPLWTAFAMLASLWYAQSFRRGGRWPSLVLSALSVSLAGGLWSAGHLAGPMTAVYLWVAGGRRCRLAAVVPMAASVVTVALLLSMATRPMDSTVSFHGRTAREAANPIQGAITTAQAIPESLVLANLGLKAETTPIQGIVLTLSLVALWVSRRWRRDPRSGVDRGAGDAAVVPGSRQDSTPRVPRPFRASFTFNPLESAGAAMVVGCYLLEWTFRGYLEYQSLRTLSPYVIVPWYDVIPQIGAVLFAVGWWSEPRVPTGSVNRRAHRRPAAPTRSATLVVGLMSIALIVVNRPRVDALIQGTIPAPNAFERDFFRIPRLLTMRAGTVVSMRVDWQRRYLRRLDQAEPVARRLGIGQDGIRAAFGIIFIPASTGRLLLVHQDLYDVAAVLNLPAHGRNMDVAAIRAALAEYLVREPGPRPPWISRSEPWSLD